MERYRTVIVMGVAGSGKTTVGRLLARRLGLEFVDGDDFHSRSNLTKMANGRPLNDDDRWPWLRDISEWIDAHPASVVACSALKRSYRDLLRRNRPGLRFVYLEADPELVRDRMANRRHVMPASLADSQFADLEPPNGSEPAVTVSVVNDPDLIVSTAAKALGKPAGASDQD